MTERCEPPEETGDYTHHIITTPRYPKGRPALWKERRWFLAGADPMGWPLDDIHNIRDWRYVGPLDLSVERMTPADKAVVDAAAAWRDREYHCNGKHADYIDEERALLAAIDIVRPYVAPDPVGEALAALRAAVGEDVKFAAWAYLGALDAAKGKAP